MGGKFTELDTKLVNFLQGNKATILSVIFSINRTSFLSLQEKKSFAPLLDKRHLYPNGFQN